MGNTKPGRRDSNCVRATDVEFRLHTNADHINASGDENAGDDGRLRHPNDEPSPTGRDDACDGLFVGLMTMLFCHRVLIIHLEPRPHHLV